MPRILKKTVRGLQLLFSRKGRSIWGYRMRNLYFDVVVAVFRPTHISVRSPFGVRWILPAKDPTSRWIFSEPGFDRAGMQACLDLIRPDDVVVDGGANFGLYSKLFSRAVREQGAVIAVEPFDHTARTLRKQLDGAPSGQIRIVQSPLWSREVSLNLIARENDREDCQRVRGEKEKSHTKETRQALATTLDQILSDLGWRAPSLIKLDVEGSELDALKGARRMLDAPSPPWIYLEINPPLLRAQGATEQQLMDLMIGGHGYRLAVFHEKSWRWIEPDGLRELLARTYVNVLAKPPRGEFCERGGALALAP